MSVQGALRDIIKNAKLRSVPIAVTAGNIVTNLTAGTNKRWLILYGRVTLVADATVANRYIEHKITDGTNVLMEGNVNSTAITAGQTRTNNYGLYTNGTASGSNDTWQISFIHDMLIEKAMQLRFKIAGGQAGDSYSGYIVVLEWNV